ncbi:hypothetical protein B0H11DRAFT_2281241 [Mycena galericulata]|nr:hypothetical protein B0H11DRAFT_2281241 [Mycena galericulata]
MVRFCRSTLSLDEDCDEAFLHALLERALPLVGLSSGGRRAASRNAKTGSEIARGLKAIGQGMSAPIITKADTSRVDAIVDIFTADPTLLPADPEGEYYDSLLDALSANEMRTRVFIRTPNRIQHITLLKQVLTEKEMEVPVQCV